MMDLCGLYGIAKQNNIPVDRFSMGRREALSIMDTDGQCCIAIDPGKLKGETDERSKLAHELGHCLTGSFYNIHAARDSRTRHENRADKWAIQALIPVEELDDAVAEGCTEIWELAERFQVTEELMRKAVCYYVHGNLATELYF